MNRILWLRRPRNAEPGSIDELVLHDAATVHVEQLDERCWWIGLSGVGGNSDAEWSGYFTTDRRGRMRFTQGANDGVVWDRDATHEEEKT